MRQRLARLAQNSALLFALNLMIRLSSAFLFWLLTRRDATDAGIFTLAMSYMLIVEALSLWGLDQLLIRDVAHDRALAQQLFPRYGALRLLLSLVGVAGCVITIGLNSSYSIDHTVVIMVFILAVITEGFNDLCLALFIALDSLRWPTILGIGVAILRIMVAGVVIVTDQPLLVLMIILVLMSALMALINGIVLHRSAVPLLPIFDWSMLGKLFRTAMPLGLINLLWALDAQGGNVLLSKYVLADQLTIYGSATTLFSGLLLFPAAVQSAIFPSLTRLFRTDRSAFQVRYGQLSRALAFGGVGIVLMVLVAAPTLVTLLFAPRYYAAVGLLQVLGCTLLFNFLTIPNSRTMIIGNKLWTLVGLLCVSLVINWILVITLLPKWGTYAVVTARVASMGSFVLMNHWVVRRLFVPIPLWQLIWQPLVAGIGACAVWYSLSQSPILQTVIPLLVYFGLSGALLMMRSTDRRMLLGLFRRRLAHNTTLERL